ncbi:MAG: GGDEF domain-containing protein [Ectothiorhodospiraceae bacterium]|nr:GGDEF domain-containing protein [Ectothiorhodospiraceae bacterium]
MQDTLFNRLDDAATIDVTVLLLKVIGTGVSLTLLIIAVVFALSQRGQRDHQALVARCFALANLFAAVYVGADAAVRVDALLGDFSGTLFKIQLALTATVLSAAAYINLYWAMAADDHLPRAKAWTLYGTATLAVALLWIKHPSLVIASDDLIVKGMSVFADYGTLTPWYFAFVLTLTSIVLLTLMRSPQRHIDRTGWRLNLAGFLVLLAGGVHDALRELGYFLLPFSTLSFGLVCFQIGAFGFLASHYARTLRERTRQRQRLRRLNDELERDPATGLFSRRYLQDLLDRKPASGRGGLLFIDLDNFKSINDRFGHLFGDQVIATAAQELRSQLRAVDVPCRWGGDEFLVYLPDTGPEDIGRLAARLRDRVTALRFDSAPGLSIRMSMGYSGLGADGWRASVARADQALYASKHRGRDQLTVSASDTTVELAEPHD